MHFKLISVFKQKLKVDGEVHNEIPEPVEIDLQQSNFFLFIYIFHNIILYYIYEFKYSNYVHIHLHKLIV